MTVTCNGACKNYKAEKKRDTKRYQNGDKFCGYCNIFIKWEGKYCPCYTTQLRTSPRSSRSNMDRKYIE